MIMKDSLRNRLAYSYGIALKLEASNILRKESDNDSPQCSLAIAFFPDPLEVD